MATYRKFLISLVVGIAVAVPSIVAASGTDVAAAPVPPETCPIVTTLTLPSPGGISKAGVAAQSPRDIWTSLSFSGSGCSGSASPVDVNATTVRCDKHTPGLPATNPACQPGFFGYDSWANFDQAGLRTAASFFPSDFAANINGSSGKWQRHRWTASAIAPGGICGSSEEGFQITGPIQHHIKQTMTLTVCLGAVSGTGLTSSTFLGASQDQNGVVQTVAIDPATSSLTIG